jgi:hypothetical protein
MMLKISDVLVLVPANMEVLSAFWYISMSMPIKKEPESSVDASTKPAIVLGALSEKAVLSIDGWRFMSAREP